MIELLMALAWNKVNLLFAPESERVMRLGVYNTKTDKKYEVNVDLEIMTDERLEIVIRECLKQTR